MLHIFGFTEGCLVRRLNVNHFNDLEVAGYLEYEPHKSTWPKKIFEEVPSDANILSEFHVFMKETIYQIY